MFYTLYILKLSIISKTPSKFGLSHTVSGPKISQPPRWRIVSIASRKPSAKSFNGGSRLCGQSSTPQRFCMLYKGHFVTLL